MASGRQGWDGGQSVITVSNEPRFIDPYASKLKETRKYTYGGVPSWSAVAWYPQIWDVTWSTGQAPAKLGLVATDTGVYKPYRFFLHDMILNDAAVSDFLISTAVGSRVTFVLYGDSAQAVSFKNAHVGVASAMGFSHKTSAVAKNIASGSLVPKSRRKLTVGGSDSFTIPANGTVTTDEVYIDINKHSFAIIGFDVKFTDATANITCANVNGGYTLMDRVYDDDGKKDSWYRYETKDSAMLDAGSGGNICKWAFVQDIYVTGGSDSLHHNGKSFLNKDVLGTVTLAGDSQAQYTKPYATLGYAFQRNADDPSIVAVGNQYQTDHYVTGGLKPNQGEWGGLKSFSDSSLDTKLIAPDLSSLDVVITGTHTGNTETNKLIDTTASFTEELIGCWVQNDTNKAHGGYVSQITSETELLVLDTVTANPTTLFPSGSTFNLNEAYTIFGDSNSVIDGRYSWTGIDFQAPSQKINVINQTIQNCRGEDYSAYIDMDYPSVAHPTAADSKVFDITGISTANRSITIDIGDGIFRTIDLGAMNSIVNAALNKLSNASICRAINLALDADVAYEHWDGLTTKDGNTRVRITSIYRGSLGYIKLQAGTSAAYTNWFTNLGKLPTATEDALYQPNGESLGGAVKSDIASLSIKKCIIDDNVASDGSIVYSGHNPSYYSPIKIEQNILKNNVIATNDLLFDEGYWEGEEPEYTNMPTLTFDKGASVITQGNLISEHALIERPAGKGQFLSNKELAPNKYMADEGWVMDGTGTGVFQSTGQHLTLEDGNGLQGDHLALEGTAGNATSQWTVEIWYRVYGDGASSSSHEVILFDDNSANNFIKLKSIDATGHAKVVCDLNGVNQIDHDPGAGIELLTDQQWHHIAVAKVPGATMAMVLHIDGVKQVPASTPPSSNKDWSIKRVGVASTGAVNIEIANVKVWMEERSTANILNDATFDFTGRLKNFVGDVPPYVSPTENTNFPSNPLVLHWTFNEIPLNTNKVGCTSDLSGYGFHGLPSAENYTMLIDDVGTIDWEQHTLDWEDWADHNWEFQHPMLDGTDLLNDTPAVWDEPMTGHRLFNKWMLKFGVSDAHASSTTDLALSSDLIRGYRDTTSTYHGYTVASSFTSDNPRDARDLLDVSILHIATLMNTRWNDLTDLGNYASVVNGKYLYMETPRVYGDASLFSGHPDYESKLIQFGTYGVGHAYEAYDALSTITHLATTTGYDYRFIGLEGGVNLATDRASAASFRYLHLDIDGTTKNNTDCWLNVTNKHQAEVGEVVAAINTSFGSTIASERIGGTAVSEYYYDIKQEKIAFGPSVSFDDAITWDEVTFPKFIDISSPALTGPYQQAGDYAYVTFNAPAVSGTDATLKLFGIPDATHPKYTAYPFSILSDRVWRTWIGTSPYDFPIHFDNVSNYWDAGYDKFFSVQPALASPEVDAGGGIALRSGAAEIKTNVFENNESALATIVCDTTADVDLRNNTAIETRTVNRDASLGGYPLFLSLKETSSAYVRYNIFVDCGVALHDSTATIKNKYNNFYATPEAGYDLSALLGYWGTAISPDFVSYQKGRGRKGWQSLNNYRLKSSTGSFKPGVGALGVWSADEIHSTLIDGTLSSEYINEKPPHGKYANMGAYGTTRTASFSTVSAATDLYAIEKDDKQIDVFWTMPFVDRTYMKGYRLFLDDKRISRTSPSIVIDKYASSASLKIGQQYRGRLSDTETLYTLDLEADKIWFLQLLPAYIGYSGNKTESFAVPLHKVASVDELDFRGSGISYPFDFSKDGRVSMTTGSDKIREDIMMVLMTRKGDRVMRPYFGAGLERQIFNNLELGTETLIVSLVKEALKSDTRIQVLDVQIIEKYTAVTGDKQMELNLKYIETDTGSTRAMVFPFYTGG